MYACSEGTNRAAQDSTVSHAGEIPQDTAECSFLKMNSTEPSYDAPGILFLFSLSIILCNHIYRAHYNLITNSQLEYYFFFN